MDGMLNVMLLSPFLSPLPPFTPCALDTKAVVEELVRGGDWLKPPTGWTPAWGPKQDGALMIGVEKHGFGRWKEMAEDADLGLEGRMHLDPQDGSGKGKTLSPKPLNVHRRAEAVLRFLQRRSPGGSSTSRSRMAKGMGRNGVGGGVGRSLGEKRKARESPEELESPESRDVKRSRTSSSPASTPVMTEDGGPDGEGERRRKLLGLSHEQIRICKEELRPVKRHLRWLQEEASSLGAEEKLKGTTRAILQIGRYILGEGRRVRKEALWSFVVLFWPSFIKPEVLSSLYTKVEKREQLARASGGSKGGSGSSSASGTTGSGAREGGTVR